MPQLSPTTRQRPPNQNAADPRDQRKQGTGTDTNRPLLLPAWSATTATTTKRADRRRSPNHDAVSGDGGAIGLWTSAGVAPWSSTAVDRPEKEAVTAVSADPPRVPQHRDRYNPAHTRVSPGPVRPRSDPGGEVLPWGGKIVR